MRCTKGFGEHIFLIIAALMVLLSAQSVSPEACSHCIACFSVSGHRVTWPTQSDSRRSFLAFLAEDCFALGRPLGAAAK
jgi:hypothetical protein